MQTLQNILIDSLNGFSLSQIPLFIFQLLCAGIGAHLFQFVLNRKLENTMNYAALTAVGVATIASIVKYSLPFSVLGAAIILLLLQKDAKQTKIQTLAQVIVVLIGVGCGIGSVIQTIIGCIIILAVIFFTPIKK